MAADKREVSDQLIGYTSCWKEGRCRMPKGHEGTCIPVPTDTCSECHEPIDEPPGTPTVHGPDGIMHYKCFKMATVHPKVVRDGAWAMRMAEMEDGHHVTAGSMSVFADAVGRPDAHGFGCPLDGDPKTTDCVHCGPVAEYLTDWSEMRAFMRRRRQWSEQTFGPGDRTVGTLEHIRKEILEIEIDPGDPVEWVDILLLALDGAARIPGVTDDMILSIMLSKQKKNEAREWPDWRTAPTDRPVEHVRKDGEDT